MNRMKYYEGCLVGEQYKPGMRFEFKIAVPDVACEEYALLVEHDGQNDANVKSMLKLADEGKAPYCVSVGVLPGSIEMSDGSERWMRMNSYDLFDREYGDFVVYELLPYVIKEYSLKLSSSPDMHFISGGSSGGISAFVVAWFHPEYFHRVFMSSPSFLAMGRGNEIPYLIRKYETKPLRIYEESSEDEPNYFFGWSRAIDEEAREALIYAGYDFQFKYFPGEDHCSRNADENEAYIRNEWLWKDWETKKVTAPRNSPQVSQVIPHASKWERCATFPEPEQEAEAPAVLAENFENVVLSNDGLAWYAGNPDDDIVLMFVNAENLSVEKGLLHATLHTIPRIGPKGAIDLAVDKVDRLFVLTSIGIQCVRSFGLIDVILDLPDQSKPIAMTIADALYVKTEMGVYKRPLCEICTKKTDRLRMFDFYYD